MEQQKKNIPICSYKFLKNFSARSTKVQFLALDDDFEAVLEEFWEYLPLGYWVWQVKLRYDLEGQRSMSCLKCR
jgi:hypothetical protein